MPKFSFESEFSLNDALIALGMEVVEPVEMKVDRPFIFLISDDDTGTILFAGRVLNPES
jgi:serpin B